MPRILYIIPKKKEKIQDTRKNVFKIIKKKKININFEAMSKTLIQSV